jgi:hypothetical protein
MRGMTTIIRKLAERLKGTMQETEDWWHLMRDDDGSLFVEHSWSHTSLNSLTTDNGETRIEIEAFLESDHPWASPAKAALREYLAEQGVG